MPTDKPGGEFQDDRFRIETDAPTEAADDVEINTGDESEVEFDEHKLSDLMMRIEGEQSLAMAVIGGIGGAIAGAIAWGAITALTGYQIGFMAIGVGFLVGYLVRLLGKGISNTFGYIGAVFALLGCVMGNVFSGCMYLAIEEQVPMVEAILLAFNPMFAIAMLQAMFSPIDLLFYGFAVYEGYRFSFRQITEEELMSAVKST